MIKECNTFTATISVGLREGYNNLKIHTISEVEEICQEYCDKVGLCVTITPTKFIYTDGSEEGVLVGLINYPRFPESTDAIREKSFSLAEILKNRLGQYRVSIIYPDKTIVLDN